MIDLHCHLLPGIDDGAQDLDSALAMARIAVEDGITMTACTPHIYPGLFDNDAPGIKRAVEQLREHLEEADIPLQLTFGADIQIDPELVAELKRGKRPTIHGTRYFLFEPPHHIAPPRFTEMVFHSVSGGFVPLITHPERLTWLDEKHYEWMLDAARQGAWIQVTSGALTGRFGRKARYWAERMIDDGIVHVLATDAHSPEHRPPLLAEGREAAARRLGATEAELLVLGRPAAVIEDRPPEQVPQPPGLVEGAARRRRGNRKRGWFTQLLLGDE